MQRKRTSRVAALVSWVLRYGKALIDAAFRGDEAVVQLLLEKGINLESKNKDSQTLLL